MGDRWVAASIGVSGLVLELPPTLSAGFLYDDWYLVAHQIFAIPITGVYVGPGPTLALALEAALFRANAHLWYASAAVIFTVAVVALYAALRALRVDQLPAAITCALLLAFPAADSLRLWYAANVTVALAATLALLAIAAATRWIERRPRADTWLGVSVLLWVAALSCYFSVVVLVLLPLALIPLSRDARRTLLSFGVNVAVGVVCLAVILPSSLSAQYHASWALSEYPARAWALWTAGYQFLIAGPFGQITLGAVGLGVAASSIVTLFFVARGPARQLQPASPSRSARMLIASGLLLVGALAAWTPLIPAPSYYTPSTLGVGNRVNGLAQIFVLAAIGMIVTTVADFAGRLARRPIVAPACAAGVAACLLASSLPQTITHAQGYSDATSQRNNILTLMAHLVAAPRDGTTVLIGDYNAYDTGNWIPVFASTYDFNGAVQIAYLNPTLFGYPVLAGYTCTAGGLGGLPSGAAAVPYDRVIVIDVGRRRIDNLSNRAGCASALPGLQTRLYPG